MDGGNIAKVIRYTKYQFKMVPHVFSFYVLFITSNKKCSNPFMMVTLC